MSALAALALKSGLPLIGSILKEKLGSNGQLVTEVLEAVAGHAGVKPDDLDQLAEENAPKALDAMRAVTDKMPELIALYTKGLENQLTLLMAEQEEGGWKAAWRPAGMWMIGFLWIWNVVVLHVANAVWKIALPPMPWDVLMQISGLYMGLYMGGHTIKDAMAKLAGAKK